MPGYTPRFQNMFNWEDMEGGGKVVRLGDDNVKMSIVKLNKGESYPGHAHSVGSYMYVVSGEIEIDGHVLSAGDAGNCGDINAPYSISATQDTVYIVCRSADDEVTMK